MFATIGYLGTSNHEQFLNTVAAMESLGKILLVVAVIVISAGYYYLKNHGGVHEWLQQRLNK
jgi:hypothetical protein